jgi:YD repeat-containing protein
VKCHVVEKSSPQELTELQYDSAVDKVSYVKKTSRSNPQTTSWSKFVYDAKGNLVSAKNSEGKGTKLVYDSEGRIRALADEGGHQVSFKYDENSKPVEISDPKLGTITVSYTNSGEIKKVESTAGKEVAARVTQEFQELLDIIRPAGVTLSF